ncbi:MAG: TonB-dependent receptor [Woeseiaceae bacterium]
MKSTLCNFRMAVAAAVGLTAGLPALAQDDFVIEEITVYAQKRAQNLMDVPVAVTAVTGQAIQDSGIKDVFDLQQNVPSLVVGQSQTATSSNFQIRSIGSTSNNFGVESSVGLYVDGVYRSRQSTMVNDLIDVEAVEVLRGPQGTLFGKNTAAGAISVRTVAPSQTPDAFVDVTGGDLGLVRVSAATNVPLTDTLAFRGTIFSTQRDGIVDDDHFGEDVHNDRDRLGLRLQLGYEGDNWDARIIADYAEIDEVCCVALSRVDSLFSRVSQPFPNFTPGTDFIMASLGATVFTNYPHDPTNLAVAGTLPGTVITGVGFEDFRTAYDILPRSTNEDRGLSLELNREMDAGTFTSVTAFRAFDTYDLIDVDFTDLPMLGRTNEAQQEAFSQEFRFAGEFGEASNYVVGAYYFGQEIASQQDFFSGAFAADSGLPPLVGLPFQLYLGNLPPVQTLESGVNAVSAATGGLYPVAGAPVTLGAASSDDVIQDHKSWAVFFQTDIVLSDAFTLTLGGRYTDEQKDIAATYTQSLPDNPFGPPNFGLMGIQLCSLDPVCAPTLPPGSPVFNPATSGPIFAPFSVDGWAMYLFDPLVGRPPLNESISDDQFTGNAKLSWYATDNVMLYASYATGYKAGGTNTDRISPQFDSVFGPETATSAEIGMKGTFGRLRLAIAAYMTDIEDFQANSFTGSGFNLQNAGEIETKGVEVEFNWQMFDTFSIDGFVARNEGEFKSFANGTCWDAYPFHTGMNDPALPPDFNPIVSPEVCDRSGNKVGYNPENRAFVALTKDFIMGDNNLFFRVEYSYASEQLTDGDLDPFTLQDDVNLINVRAGMDIDSWNSTITLWGRNVTDERYYHGSFDAPAQDGRMNSYPSDPASYGITFRKNWD